MKENTQEKNNLNQLFNLFLEYVKKSISIFKNLKKVYYLIYNFFYEKKIVN